MVPAANLLPFHSGFSFLFFYCTFCLAISLPAWKFGSLVSSSSLPNLPQDPFLLFPFLILPLFTLPVALPAFCCRAVGGCNSLKSPSQAALEVLKTPERQFLCLVLVPGPRPARRGAGWGHGPCLQRAHSP